MSAQTGAGAAIIERGYISAGRVCELVPGMTKAKLAQMRFRGEGPTFYRPTPKTILYAEAEIIAWIENSQRSGTAEVN